MYLRIFHIDMSIIYEKNLTQRSSIFILQFFILSHTKNQYIYIIVMLRVINSQVQL